MYLNSLNLLLNSQSKLAVLLSFPPLVLTSQPEKGFPPSKIDAI